jgi:hypothetical protein
VTSGQVVTPSVRFASVDEYHVPLDSLRALAADCWPAAWLRFTRAPVIENGRLFDLRFESAGRGNFTTMRRPARDSQPGCPGFVPGWKMPRADAIRAR